MKIEKVGKTEYASMIRFLENVFNAANHTFVDRYPQFWRKESVHYEDILSIKEHGRIVAMLRIFPLDLRLDSARLLAGGIGAVATDYACRGKGYMSALMNAATREMQRRGYALSVLWGLRHRYSHFGYELGGQSVELIVNPRAFEKMGVKERPLQRFYDDRSVLKNILACYRRQSFRKERTSREFQRIFLNRRGTLYHAGCGDRFAYIVLRISGGDGQVLEQGGDPDLMLSIMKQVAARSEIKEFKLSYPVGVSIPTNVLSVAGTWRILPSGMLKILDLRKTLGAYRDYLTAAWDGADGEIVLGLDGQTPVAIVKRQADLWIREVRNRKALVLNETDMVKLLFGMLPWLPPGITGEQERILKRMFPLKFFMWPLDYV